MPARAAVLEPVPANHALAAMHYRIYYVRRGAEIVILLCAGDKRTQQQDIKRARELAERL